MTRPTATLHSESMHELGCHCEGCGRTFETPLRLTNLSEASEQIYDACPFCFSRFQLDEASEEPDEPETLPLIKPDVTSSGNEEEAESSASAKCPHHFGYLKKRPKKSPIPDACLTCERMVRCVL